jgi:uncharacterized protein YbaR (Trm112 family)
MNMQLETGASTMATIDDKLLEILVCPKCKTKVILQGEELACTNSSCGLLYPIENGIPVMLIDKAKAPQSGS